MPLARVGPLDLLYDIRGRGPRLLFISGTGADLRRPPTHFDRLLDAHFEVLRFDQRGMGQSGKPDLPYTMADYAADAAGLMDFVGWADARVLGYSFGGMVAQELALAQPARVSRLALLATTAGGEGGASYPLHTLSDLPLEEKARTLTELGDTRRDAAWQAAHPDLFQALMQDFFTAQALLALDPAAGRGAQLQLEARRQHDTWSRLPQLACPVAVFGGQHDGIASPEALERLAERIPGARLCLFQGGHLVQVQNRQAAHVLVEWLLAGAV